MNITYKQTKKERYGNSIVYSFNVFVDGVVIEEEDSGDSHTPREFAVQVQDGCCATKALKDTLHNIKLTLEAQADDIEDMPEIDISEI